MFDGKRKLVKVKRKLKMKLYFYQYYVIFPNIIIRKWNENSDFDYITYMWKRK